METKELLITVGEILLGAAHADGHCDRSEIEQIHSLLAAQPDALEHMEEIGDALAGFDPGVFRLEQACDRLGLDSAERRRWLLRLVAEVTLADEIVDFEESLYVMQVGRAIGATPEELSGLAGERVAASSGLERLVE